jgi:hypothetical protein
MDPNLPSGSQASSTILQLEGFYRAHMEKEITAQQAKWKAQEAALLQEIQQLRASGAPT